jgi:hypothetical protein
MLSYEQHCEAYGSPPPAPEADEEPTVFGPLLATMAEPYPKPIQALITQYDHLRVHAPQLLQGLLLTVWWEHARGVTGITSPGRYRRAIN